MPKFQKGDRVTSEVTPGIGTVLDVKNPKLQNRQRPGPYYQVAFPGYPSIWHPENELTPVKKEVPSRFNLREEEPHGTQV